MVIWLTGLSGAGKTTLSQALVRRYKPQVPEMVQLDGDEIREVFEHSLGYTESDRFKQIQRIQRLALMLDRQGMVVVVSALYCHPVLLTWNRQSFSSYFEVYLDAPLSLVTARDAKGLYAEAKRRELPQVVGIDIPWHAPLSPQLHVDATTAGSADQIAGEIGRHVPRLADAIGGMAKVAEAG